MTTKKDSGLEGLSRAEHLKPRLDRAADNLNDKVRAFERALESLKLGVVARVSLWQSDEDPAGEDLVFQRHGDRWRLLVDEWDSFSGGRTSQFTPLSSSSRETRITAVAAFPRLLDALWAASERELQRLEESALAVDRLMATFKVRT